MNMTFKAPMSKKWTLLDNSIIVGKKEYLFSEIKKVEHKPPQYKSNNGMITIYVEGGFLGTGEVFFAYKYSERENGEIAFNFLNDNIDDSAAREAEKKAQEIAEKGYRKRCNVCGKIFCYTLEDIAENKRKARSAALSGLGGIAGALSGNYAAGATSNQSAEDQINRIIDYDKCPSCGSKDLVDITDEDIAKINAQQNGQSAISSADELKKFKELLDMGVITQEEFDQKKKQLLGL